MLFVIQLYNAIYMFGVYNVECVCVSLYVYCTIYIIQTGNNVMFAEMK